MKLVESAIQETCKELYELACTDTHYAGMATTITLCLIRDSKAIMAHVGDCRLYILRNNQIHRLSTDHTMATELIQRGELKPTYRGRLDNVLTRSLGPQESVPVDSLLFDLLPTDVCLLCSDGLSRYVEKDNELTDWLSGDSLESIPGTLVEYARSRGGEDNISVIVAGLERSSSTPESQDAKDLETMLGTLESVPLFSNLALRPLLQLFNITRLEALAPGEEFIREGHDTPGLCVISNGGVELSERGEPIARLGPGSHFGMLSLVRSRGARLTVKAAEEPTKILVLKKTDFERFTKRLPKLGHRLLRRLSSLISEELDALPPLRRDGRLRGAWF